jgi:hypothetical protein
MPRHRLISVLVPPGLYAGVKIPYTSDCKIHLAEDIPTFPAFRGNAALACYPLCDVN